MSNAPTERIYKSNVKIIFIAAMVILGLYFAFEIITVLLLFFFAIVLALVLNAPTIWLVSKKVPRTIAAIIVFILMLCFMFLIGRLTIPRIFEEVSGIVNNLPKYFENLKGQLVVLANDYPSLQEKIQLTTLEDNLPPALNMVTRLGRFSFSIIGTIFLMVIFLSIVAYMLINPGPLVETYLTFFTDDKREKAAQALAKASNMMVGWMWSNLVVGFIEAIAVFIFLSFMGVPGVWVWAGLALLAELVPKLGLYIMALPPTLIALSIDPMMALWVLIFYVVLNEIMGSLVMPRINASTMNLHPVSTLFVMLAMASAFGFIGALVATPVTAFIKAYYETFHVSNTPRKTINEQVEIVLHRKV